MFRFIFRKGEEEVLEEVMENGLDSDQLLSINEHSPLNGERRNLQKNTQGDSPYSSDLLQIDLVRYSKGAYDMMGKLYFHGHFQCFTLEGNVAGEEESFFLPAGLYEVTLNSHGGKNAAYGFRYQHMHRGMLHILRGQDFPFPCIHQGNRYTDRKGSILVGKIPIHEKELSMRRELWFSDESYKKIYPELAGHLLEGGKVQLWIREEFQPLLPGS